MTEDQVAIIIKQYVESLFPKTCPCCQRVYNTLREYLLVTTPIGLPISYDVDLGNKNPEKIIGTIASFNCPCGTTLSISSEQMEHNQRVALLDWLFQETAVQGVGASELLDRLRTKVSQLVLEEQEKEKE
jgi:hypothetical protein